MTGEDEQRSLKTYVTIPLWREPLSGVATRTTPEEKMEMEIRFAGGTKVDACWQGQIIRTDQPIEDGGEGSAPEPFVYFLASIGTCAAYYVLTFCRSRDISTEGLTLKQKMEWDTESHRLDRITLEISTPPDFPQKYRKAVIKAAEKCTVARTIRNSPSIEVVTAD